MIRTNPLFTVVRFAVVCAVLHSLATIGAAHAQNTPAGLDSDPVLQTWKKQKGVQACGRCHYQLGNAFATPDPSFSRQNELKFWLAEDKHAIARRRVEPLTKDEVLAEGAALLEQYREAGISAGLVKEWLGASNVLSRRICDKLGYNVAIAEGYSQFRDHCLTCHGGYRGPGDDVDFARSGGEQPGISCNYCHQIGDNDAWVEAHGVTANAAAKWRPSSPEEKTKAGMRDLVQTSTQASLCFDCHIGNRSEHKFVSHEMYAAGHPPLPSIELETFCNQMPQHWQTSSQLYDSLAGYDQRDAYFAVNFPGLFDNQGAGAGKIFWKTRKMLIGALTARKKMLDLVIQSAESHQWADYSLYDCAACHHELRTPSERQARGFPAAPGRPRQHEWPDSLLHIGLFFSGDEAAIKEMEAALTGEFGEQPFGDPARVAPAAKQLRDRLDAALKVAEEQPVNAGTARRVLTGLARTPSDKLLTYDAARQVVWAMRTIAAELEAAGEPLNDQLSQMIADLGKPTVGPNNVGVEALLPAGRTTFIYPENLAADLQRRAAYRPGELVKRLRQINTMLAIAKRKQTERLVSQPTTD